jgi:hypothetical protein
MRRSCCVRVSDVKTLLFAMNQMERLGINVISVTDNWSPNAETNDRFHLFGWADNDEQIHKLCLDFSTDPQV